MKTWLLQRAKFSDRDFKKGIDSIVQFDYMGSSEFEWDALPNSLGRIRANEGSYTYLDVPIGDKVITVFCKESQKTEIKQYLETLAEGKMNTKEWHAFDSYITGEGYFQDRADLWWDIENDLMFWKKSPDFELKFKLVIQKKPE